MTWGYNTPESEGSPAVWGARAIWPNRNSKYPLDILPDRQSLLGSTEAKDGLIHLLNEGVLEAVQARMQAYARAGIVRPDTRNEVVLFESNVVKVVGNSNASHGYFYVTAFIKPIDCAKHVPDDTEKDLAEFAEDEFRWSGPRTPAVGEEVILSDRFPNRQFHGRRVKVLAHAIEAKHLFLVIEGLEPDREDIKREREGILDVLRTGTVPRHRDHPGYVEHRIQQDPTDCLWLPRSRVSWVMGREWKETPELLESVETRHGTCTLERGDERFIMTSPATGVHSLSIDCTDDERLQAHWTGFVGMNNILEEAWDLTNTMTATRR